MAEINIRIVSIQTYAAIERTFSKIDPNLSGYEPPMRHNPVGVAFRKLKR